MKMVTFGREALTPSRRYLPLLKVALATATLVVAAINGLQDTPIVAPRPSEPATLDMARVGRLPAAGEANIPLSGPACPERDGAVLDQASSADWPRPIRSSLFIGLVALGRSRLGLTLFASEQGCVPTGVGAHP